MGDMTVDELKDKKLWFLWSAKPGKNGKVTKVPFAANGGATGTDDAHKGSWVSFDDAESARNQFQASGLGLKIPKGFFLLDIDHKDISDPFAQLMLSRFSSYAEVSPSGKGIHIIGQCDITKLPVHFDDRRKRLQAIIEDRNAPKVEKAIDGYSGFLFYDDNGMPLVAMHWQHRFNHMVGRYNDIYRVQMPNITPHVCRHTYCSNVAKSGMNPKTLQYLMGHSDISVTMNVYTHIGFDDAEEELKRMEEFRKAQAEVEQKKEKPMSQKMFKVV